MELYQRTFFALPPAFFASPCQLVFMEPEKQCFASVQLCATGDEVLVCTQWHSVDLWEWFNGGIFQCCLWASAAHSCTP